jgi:hypothetical protein
MMQETAIKLFEERKIRTHWDETSEEWYFSVIDVVEALTDSVNPRDYWFKMKQRVTLEDGIELSTICRQLKMLSSDGKKYLTDCASVQSLLRIIQSVPSPRPSRSSSGWQRWVTSAFKRVTTPRKASTVHARIGRSSAEVRSGFSNG